MNDLGYGQLSNPNKSLNLLLIRVGNRRELFLQYLYYLGKGFHCISFLESIFLNIKDEKSHLNHIIMFEDFMSYLIYGSRFISHNQNMVIHPQDVFGVLSKSITYTILI